ncbi:MAG: zinc ABC transporter substrate-binding protein [Chloroflexi bacterium]|nr:zinc ABC transporter substrate-binding protein [Chloroflexota bacterium]
MTRGGGAWWWVIALIVGGMVMAGCASSGSSGGTPSVVAAEDFWGSIAAQIGGAHIKVTNIIDNPDADPHDYEPTASDARTIADAKYVIENGAGYDAWMDKLLSANKSSSRRTLDIAKFLGKQSGDNPHLWYNPDYVVSVVGKIRDDLKAIDAADAAAFDAGAQQYLDVGLKQYKDLIASIKAAYAGTPVGATESIFAYLAPALGLNLITPASYLSAVSEGQDVAAADEAAVERQIDQGQIKALVYNSQNTPPNIRALLDRAKGKGIPVATITETLTPQGASFQEWQSRQLQGIAEALRRGTGK